MSFSMSTYEGPGKDVKQYGRTAHDGPDNQIEEES